MRSAVSTFALGVSLCAVLGLTLGCPIAPRVPEEIPPTGKHVQPSATCEELALVLKWAVEDDGRVNPHMLNFLAETLQKQLDRLAVTGPGSTPKLLPTESDRLAYWYNARMAWTLDLVRRHGCPEKLPPAALNATRFTLDGRRMGLADVDAILSADGDWRTSAVAPGVYLHRARMPQKPFTGADVRGRIARRLGELIDDQERFVIDLERRVARVPSALWRQRERILDLHKRRYGVATATLRTALLRYVDDSPHRRLQDSVGFRYVPAASDNRLLLVPQGTRNLKSQISNLRCPRPATRNRAKQESEI